MNALHTRLTTTAQMLITKHGRNMKLTSITEASEWDDRLEDDKNSIVFKGVETLESMIKNNNDAVQNRNTKLILASGISGINPKLQNRIDGKKILRISPVNPGEVLIIYEFEIEG